MDELEKKYIELFGENSPIPPRHIMETLVEMKENGSYEEKMKKISENFDAIKNKIENITNEELTDNNIIFDVDFDDEENKNN